MSGLAPEPIIGSTAETIYFGNSLNLFTNYIPHLITARTLLIVKRKTTKKKPVLLIGTRQETKNKIGLRRYPPGATAI